MVGRLQFGVSARRLQRERTGETDAASMLGVLLLQTVRVCGHDILRSSEEEGPSLLATPVPSLPHSVRGVGARQIHCWWPRHVLQHRQQHGPHHHVHVLHVLRDGTTHAEISVVEEASYHRSADPILHGALPLNQRSVLRLRIS